MVNIHQIRVKTEMLVYSHLYRQVRFLGDLGWDRPAGEIEMTKELKGRTAELGDGFRAEWLIFFCEMYCLDRLVGRHVLDCFSWCHCCG